MTPLPGLLTSGRAPVGETMPRPSVLHACRCERNSSLLKATTILHVWVDGGGRTKLSGVINSFSPATLRWAALCKYTWLDDLSSLTGSP